MRFYQLLTLLLPAILAGCEKDDLPPQPMEEPVGRQIILGEKLPNPYSLSVMRQAANELSGESTLKSAVVLQPTHYYLRFAPRDSAEINILEEDTTIFWYTYPMDYAIVQSGDTYTDNNLPDGVLEYLYCAVDVDHKLPDVPHDVLDELYILEDVNVVEDNTCEGYDTETVNKSVPDDGYWEALENRACELVGAEVSTNKAKWRPQGDVYYYDTSINQSIPLEGVPVRCRKSIFVTHQCCTDERGHFSFSRLRGRVDYYIRWRRDNFKIREHSGLNVAETHLKSNTKSSVTYTVQHGTLAWECATIFRAAHFYYYKARNYGLSSPSKNSLTIRPSSKYKPSLRGCYNNHVFGSDVHIYCINDKSAEIFCTTIHEIAHSVHQFWNTSKYHSYSDKMRDTWAEGMAWYLTGRVYDFSKYRSHIHGDTVQYTLLVKYLFENCGFSMTQIENGFKQETSWNGLKSYFKKLKPSRYADIENSFALCE